MRFSLHDVKKSIQRRGSELSLRLHFLRAGELDQAIKRLIAYYEQLLNQPQERFALDEARACIGDYRLANCLLATMSAWYSWQQRPWVEVVTSIGEEARSQLEVAGITAPAQLRLALYSFVNEEYSGFLDAHNRAEALSSFAARFMLSRAELEFLLTLDSDEQSLLTRATTAAPGAQEVAALYNQWAFEAALSSASSVRLTIDCAKFETKETKPAKPTPTLGVGAIIKRLCYLARRIGVYYDLSYEPADDGAPSALLQLTLYGPQEMTGVPQQYGLRLARLCRILLAYRKPSRTSAPERQSLATIPSRAIVEAVATVHFLQRAYSFDLVAALRNMLPLEHHMHPLEEQQAADAAGMFDSSIEQSFAEAFAALQNSFGVDGWSLIREPEPLLLTQGIVIPDFAFVRDHQRIYVEILGFWTQSYRERKITKLQQLQDRRDIVLAIPVESREAFSSIAPLFPIVEYAGQISVSDLLHVLRSRYDDFAQRLERIDRTEVRKVVMQRKLVPERSCYDLLHCYRRAELAQAADYVSGEGIAFIAGVGLFDTVWMECLRQQFAAWAGEVGRMPLADALRHSKERWPELAACADGTLEALFGYWPETRIQRNSIFDATLSISDGETAQDSPYDEASQASAPSRRKVVRERRSSQKKHHETEAAQGNLWS